MVTLLTLAISALVLTAHRAIAPMQKVKTLAQHLHHVDKGTKSPHKACIISRHYLQAMKGGAK